MINYIKNDKAVADVVHLITEQGGNEVALQADLSKVTEVRKLVDDSQKVVGKLDILIANEADVVIKNMVDCSKPDYDRVFNPNTKRFSLFYRDI